VPSWDKNLPYPELRFGGFVVQFLQVEIHYQAA
jgi:hypothetical protein